MLPAFAPVEELEARLGVEQGALSGGERARAQAALDDASALVREESRRDWVVDGEITAPPSLVRVVLGAALRNYRNPDGEISQTAGPFSRTVKASDVGVYLTSAELEIVRRYRQESTGLWTLQTTRAEHNDCTLFLEDSFGLELFPVGYDENRPWL